MANYFILTLDLTGPSSPTLLLENNAQYATQALINAQISVGDGNTAGYQMKLWGNIDLTWGKSNGIIKSAATATSSEEDAMMIPFSTTKQLRLASGDGNKTIYLKVFDDVLNPSSQVSKSIILDTNLPAVTISGPDVSKISKQSGKSVASFSFQVDSAFVEYKVKVVSASGSPHDTGTAILTTNGSTNMNGTGSFPANTPINCTITGADLDVASAGTGDKIIKVFVKDDAGLWSAS
jgi:hypothetical protein